MGATLTAENTLSPREVDDGTLQPEASDLASITIDDRQPFDRRRAVRDRVKMGLGKLGSASRPRCFGDF